MIMGKPIAGRNKYPFGLGGINVDAAVLKNGTTFTNINISKQRSNVVYDLLSGTDIYTFLNITTKDKDGNALLPSDSASDLVTKLPNGTFCVSIVDESTGDVVGFAEKFYLNMAILGDGSVFFLSDYGFQRDTTVYVTGVTLNHATFAGVVGVPDQLTATVLPANASNKSLTWSSSNTAVATVSGTGLVTFLTNGTSNVTATTVDGSHVASCAYTVTTAVSTVTLNKTTGTGVVAGTDQLTATVAPSTASNKTITWTTSNASIATVSNTGLVTFAGAGSVTITATSNNAKTATCTYTVTAA